MGACSSDEVGGKLRHGDVVFLCHPLQQKPAMRVQLGMAPPAAGFGFQAAGRAIGCHQLHDEGNRHSKMIGRCMPRATGIDKKSNSLP